MAVAYVVWVVIAVPLVAILAKIVLRVKPKIAMSQKSMEMLERAVELKKNAKDRKTGTSADYRKEHQRKTICLVTGQIVIFFVYQSATFNMLQIFPCTEIKISSTETARYLSADMSVDCNSDSYFGYWIYAIIFTIVFGAGIPVGSLFFVGWIKVLYDGYYELYSAFFIQGLRKGVFYWSTVTFTRRLALLCCAVFAAYPLDAYFFIWVYSVFAATELYAKPYEYKRYNLLQSASSFSILVTANTGLVFRAVHDDIAREVLTWTLIAVQVATYFVFIAEVGRLWIWKTVEQRRLDEMQDRDEAADESTREMGFRLDREDEEDAENVDRARTGRSKHQLGFDPFGNKKAAEEERERQEEQQNKIVAAAAAAAAAKKERRETVLNVPLNLAAAEAGKRGEGGRLTNSTLQTLSDRNDKEPINGEETHDEARAMRTQRPEIGTKDLFRNDHGWLIRGFESLRMQRKRETGIRPLATGECGGCLSEG